MYWETKKIHVTCFIAIFALLWVSGTEPTISLRNAYNVGTFFSQVLQLRELRCTALCSLPMVIPREGIGPTAVESHFCKRHIWSTDASCLVHK